MKKNKSKKLKETDALVSDENVNTSSTDNTEEVTEVIRDEATQNDTTPFAETEAISAPDEADEADISTDSEITDGNNVTSKVKKIRRPVKMGNSPKLVIVLTVICVLVASLLGVVNYVTRDKIASNTEKSKEISILAIFKGGTSTEKLKTDDDGREVYLVYKNKDIMGYAVFVSSSGFGGNIDMIVGMDSEQNTVGVQIVTMSETPGVGTKVKTPEFLNRFKGKTHDAPTDGVDAISGATVSSKAVIEGVKAAHTVKIDLPSIAEKKGVQILASESNESISSEDGTEKTEPMTEPAISEEAPNNSADASQPIEIPTETVPAEPTEPAVTEDLPLKDYGDGKYYVYNVDVETADDKYVIEIPKEELTATAESETAEPVETP